MVLLAWAYWQRGTETAGPTRGADETSHVGREVTATHCVAGRGSDSVRGPLGYIRAGRRALGGCQRRIGLGQAAKRPIRWRNAAGEAHRRRDSQHCQHEHGRLQARALPTLKFGRHATGDATSAPREFQRGTSSGLPSAGSVLRAAGHINGEGRNGQGDHRSHSEQPHCHVPVRHGTRLRLSMPVGGVQAGWQTSSGRLPAADRARSGCETADTAAKRWVRHAGGATASTSMGACKPGLCPR